jgi:integrase
VMSLEEVRACLKVLNRRESLVVRLSVLTGLRPGEIFALRCGQLNGVSVKVRQRVYRGKIDSPKTIHSVRDAALPGDLLFDLKSWVADLPEQGEMAWIFPSENLRTPLAKDNVWRRGIGPKLAAIGLDWVDFHVFRRTSSSLMNDQGVDGKIVSDQLGHTLDVNQNTYTQTFMKRRTDAVNTIETALKAS